MKKTITTLVMLVCAIAFAQAKNYYISSSTGNDSNSASINAPYKTLAKASAIQLSPGDTVFFKRGDTFLGHYKPVGSGTENAPVVMTSYGEGELPILSGQVGAAGGGDYAEAIRLENIDNIVLDALEIQNERLVTRSGVKDTDGFGISIHNSSNKVMRNFLFKNLTLRNVYAAQPMLDPEDFDKIQVSGIRFTCAKNTVAGKEKNINGVEIKDCYFTDLQRFGIQFKHSGGATGIGNDSINRNMNLHVHNNFFDYLGGTGVLPNSTYNCLIENNIFDHPGANTDPRMPARGSAIWNYKAINTIMQYNTVLSTGGYLDSYGIHIDKHNTNTFVQYNYMVDCIGGFVEILANSKNAVYRFNVSVNSGYRYSLGVSTWKAGASTIYVYSDRWVKDENGVSQLALCDSVYIYNNTVVIDTMVANLETGEKAFETTFNLDGKNMFVYNNIFSSLNGAKMGHLQTAVRNNDTPFTMTNNLYDGDINSEWKNMDDNPILRANTGFVGKGEGKLAYDITERSSAIDAGIAITGPKVPGAGKGVFKNITKYPSVDFFGNPVNLSQGTPNVGASNRKFDGAAISQLSEKTDWLVYPDMSNSNIRIKGTKNDDSIQVTLTNMKGQQMLSQEISATDGWYTLPFNDQVINGIYVLNIEANQSQHSRKLLLHRR